MLFAECGPLCALQACYEGVQVEIVVPEIDIFLSSTSIITLDHKKLTHNKFFGNTGHFDHNSTFMAQRASKTRKSTTSSLSRLLRFSLCSLCDQLHHASLCS